MAGRVGGAGPLRRLVTGLGKGKRTATTDCCSRRGAFLGTALDVSRTTAMEPWDVVVGKGGVICGLTGSQGRE